MPKRGGGVSGGGSLPEAPAANSLADAANATITFRLQGVDRLQNALTQCTVKCSTPLLDTPSFGGPVYAELWLLRDAGGFALQLDKGFVQGGSYRTIIGIVGSVMYVPGDQLVVFMWNDSGAAFLYKVEYATDAYDPGDVASTGAYTKLSTKHEAIWYYAATVLNDGANAGTHTSQTTFADGMTGGPLTISIINLDTVNRGSDAQQIVAGTANVVAQLLFNAALAATTADCWPKGTTYPGLGVKWHLPPSQSIYEALAAIAVSQDSRHIFNYWIQSRPPVVVWANPAGATVTPLAGSNEVR